MAGRGRARGRGMSFAVETLGFGRGEALPGPIHQPPSTFPPLEYKPVPLDSSEEQSYLLALKEEYRGAMRESPYYILPVNVKRDIERYSDKYHLGGTDNSNNWEPDWSRLPAELRIKIKRHAKLKAVIKPKLLPSMKSLEVKKEDVSKVLEELEKKEQVEEGGEESEQEKEQDEENEELEEDEIDEEEYEEENDYISTYFDNGEDYADDDDDNDEGPIY